MDFDLTTIFAICTLLAIGLIAWQLWQQRAQTPITLDSIIAALGKVPGRAQQFFDTAMIAVHFLEQISAPDAPGEPPKLTNEQKKARAMSIVKREHPSAQMEEIDIAVEGAVHAVKHSGVKLPVAVPQAGFPLTSEADLLNDWQQGSSPPAIEPLA